MRDAIELGLATILAGGHVLFEDVPGLGKTLAARSLASALGLDFRRLQCTPDLLPADITGSFVYAPSSGEFVFRPGPIFTGLFLADEINRTSPKTQSALLEAMAEGQVTVEGQSFGLPSPFTSWRPRTPSNTRAPTRSRKLNLIVSWCDSVLATPNARVRRRFCSTGSNVVTRWRPSNGSLTLPPWLPCRRES